MSIDFFFSLSLSLFFVYYMLYVGASTKVDAIVLYLCDGGVPSLYVRALLPARDSIYFPIQLDYETGKSRLVSEG